jgi:two-component system sensor histidine kinase KdpD
MVYLLGIVLVSTQVGIGAAAMAAVACAVAFDFLFVIPRFSFVPSDLKHLVTVGGMLVVGLVVSVLTARMRGQTETIAEEQRRTAALLSLSRELASASTEEQTRIALEGHLAEVGRQSEQQRLGLGLEEASISPEQSELLEAFRSQAALAFDRVRLVDEAEQARLLVETERMRSALLSSVSHDLRTPLAAITGSASSLLESETLAASAEGRELLQMIYEEANRLNRLVRNLLDMTRLQSGALEVRREWQPIEEVIGAALGRYARRLEERSVEVVMPDELVAAAIDEVLIEQVLLNLLDNCLRHTDPEAKILVRVRRVPEGVQVTVADDGQGLRPGDEERVFDKFYRGSAAAGRAGTGLGLAVCRGIVEAHGGTIWARNLPEGGVAFSLVLPIEGSPPAWSGDGLED